MDHDPLTTAASAGARPAGAGLRVAAVVLAAGFSSRMGRLKPLLPLGTGTAIERVIASLREAAVPDIVLVTGHQAESVAPLLDRLGVRRAHNAAYESGMFSSVRAGVAALSADLEGFLVIPVDCPLVTPGVVRSLLERFAAGAGSDGADILYPTCFGRRGHPPLIAARYIAPLLAADAGSTLQDFLRAYEGRQTEVDVRDLTTLMDMDTPGDYEALRHFAEALDTAAATAAAAGAGAAAAADAADGAATPAAVTTRPEPALTAADALYLLGAAGTPANVVRHCLTAAAVGEALTAELRPRVPDLDVDLVRAGCLLHDIARLLPRHATLAAAALTRLGLPRLGAVVAEHMVIDSRLPRAPGLTEAELVYLADKTVADGEVVGLDERQARTLRKMTPDRRTAEQIAGRIGEARLIADKVSAVLGRPMEDVLREVQIPPAARLDEVRVYLVRHAQPLGTAGKRFLGQQDVPLSPEGEEQAGRLAGHLMELTGGACFDAVYSSDLKRSFRTAEVAAAACGTPVGALPWLREIDVGSWEGLTWDDARERYPAEYAARELDLVRTPFPRGESFAALGDRAEPPFERLLEESLAVGRRRVLVVAHRGVNRVLLAHFQGWPLEAIFGIAQDYCAVTLLRIAAGADGRPEVVAIETR